MMMVCVSASALAASLDEATAFKIDPDKYESFVDQLFPQAKSWPRFDEFPLLTETTLPKDLIAKLTHDLEPGDLHAGRGCPTSERMFANPSVVKALRLVRATDGKTAIVYSGFDSCSWGNVTIVWPDINHLGENLASLQAGFIRRLHVQSDGRVTALIALEGCCVQTKDVYWMATSVGSMNLDLVGHLRVICRCILWPEHVVPASGAIILTERVPFRFSPVLDDLSKFDGQSRTRTSNVLGWYRQGSKLLRMLHYVSPDGHGWSLMVPDELDDWRPSSEMISELLLDQSRRIFGEAGWVED